MFVIISRNDWKQCLAVSMNDASFVCQALDKVYETDPDDDWNIISEPIPSSEIDFELAKFRLL